MKRVRLTESQLHRVIKESVKRVLKEEGLDGMPMEQQPKRYYIEGTNRDGYKAKYTKSGIYGDPSFTYAGFGEFGGPTIFNSIGAAKRALSRISDPEVTDLHICEL